MLFAADLCIRDDFGKILAVFTGSERRDDFFNILLGQLIVVRDFDKLVGGVDEEHVIGCLGVLQHHDAGGNGRPEKEVCRQLDDAIDLVVVNEIFSYLLFRAAAVHDTGEADDRRRAVACQPRERVHDEGKICLGFGRKDTRRRIARVVDEERVVAPLPRDGIGRIGDDDFKGLVIPMGGLGERIAMRDVKFVGSDVVQEHIDTAEIIRRDVDLLPEKSLTNMVLAQDLGGFQKQGTRTAGGVVNLVDFRLPDRRKARQQVRNLLRRKELPALFARVGGVHAHQILVSIAEGVDRAVLIFSELHIGDGIEELYELFIALGDRRAQLVGIDVEIVEQPLEGVLTLAPLRRIFDIMKDAFERFARDPSAIDPVSA